MQRPEQDRGQHDDTRQQMLLAFLASEPDRSLGELERAGFGVEDVLALGREQGISEIEQSHLRKAG